MSKRKRKNDDRIYKAISEIFNDVAFMKKFSFLIDEPLIYDFYYKGKKIRSLAIKDKREE